MSTAFDSIKQGLQDAIAHAKGERTAPEAKARAEAMQAVADYVTEMKMVRHPFEQGLAARKGIEF